MNRQPIRLAVVGATGLVGQTMLEILQERNFPISHLYPLASKNSKGTQVIFNEKNYMVEDLAEFDFSQADIALFSAGGSVSEQYAPIAASKNCVVIDNTSCFRYDDEIPLVVPEVNEASIQEYKKKNIIANPNCSTIQMVIALKPIYDAVGIKRVNVSTYQSVSGKGRSGVQGLMHESVFKLNSKEPEQLEFGNEIAFNVIPQIDSFQENGYTREEMKMVWETQKIFADDKLMVNPTAVRVPVFYGHAEALHIETKNKISAREARWLLEQVKGIEVKDNPETSLYPMPIIDGAGTNEVYVGRIREDISCVNGLNMWVVADNVRKGAALNSIQIAERLLDIL
jgi:aspartate-semialdehyde dehydrogenase